jgi:hypothetical protein
MKTNVNITPWPCDLLDVLWLMEILEKHLPSSSWPRTRVMLRRTCKWFAVNVSVPSVDYDLKIDKLVAERIKNDIPIDLSWTLEHIDLSLTLGSMIQAESLLLIRPKHWWISHWLSLKGLRSFHYDETSGKISRRTRVYLGINKASPFS